MEGWNFAVLIFTTLKCLNLGTRKSYLLKILDIKVIISHYNTLDLKVHYKRSH